MKKNWLPFRSIAHYVGCIAGASQGDECGKYFSVAGFKGTHSLNDGTTPSLPMVQRFSSRKAIVIFMPPSTRLRKKLGKRRAARGFQAPRKQMLAATTGPASVDRFE